MRYPTEQIYTEITMKLYNMNLKVTKVRYFETRRGLGYECETNVDGVEIWNDGDGSETRIEGKRRDEFDHVDWWKLEELINEFEGVKL